MASKASFTLDTRHLLRSLQTMPKAAREIAQEAVADIFIDIADTFDAGCDPYGVAWKARADGKKATLVDKGTLVRSRKIASTPKGELTIAYSDPVAVHHQFGAPDAHLPQRTLVPTAERGIPPRWVKILRTIFKRVTGKNWGTE